MRGLRIIVYLVIYIVFLVFCNFLEWMGFFQTGLKRTLAVEIQKKRGNSEEVVIDISAFTKFKWDRFYIFSPYTSYDAIEKELGFKWPRLNATSIEWDDGICLLVFIEDNQVVEYINHNRHLGDFMTIGKEGGYTPEEAVFEVKEEDWGEPWLVIRETDFHRMEVSN